MSVFEFKQFSIQQGDSALKVGTDAMLLGAFVESDKPLLSVLDIGVGTGVLSLMMAQKFSKSNIIGIELDDFSSKDCLFNFENSPWSERLKLIQADFLFFEFNQKFDLIVSNPPFYQTTLLNENRREATAKHEKSLPIEKLVEKTVTLLSQNGTAWFIFPFRDFSSWQEYFISNQLFLQKKISISPKKDKTPNRMIVSVSKIQSLPIEKELIIRNSDNTYTNEYIELTKDFHAKDLRFR